MMVMETLVILRPALLVLIPAALATLACGSSSPSAPNTTDPPEERLSQTGLYSDIGGKAIAPQNRAYTPQYVLWSDGGVKRRWLFLPAGTRIDSSDMDRWSFPVGTKVWKEFSFQGRRVETRLIEKIAPANDIASWRFKAYAWRADESDAVLVGEGGQLDVAPTALGTRHDIPSISSCRACHARGGDALLGVDALQMSADRDPLAVSEGQLRAGDITTTTLASEGLLTRNPGSAPRIAANTAAGRFAIGYLHGNCGNCHNPAALVGNLGMNLRHSLNATREDDAPAYATSVNRQNATYQVDGTRLGIDSYRILGGRPEQSAVLVRMRSRVVSHVMPPVGSEVQDAEAAALIAEWIRGLPRP
jgi:hypothetical protein